VVLAHGSGIDDLVMLFMFPAVVTFGFWLLTRHKGRGGEQAGEAVGVSPEPAFGSRPPVAPNATPVDGHPSPFHALIAPPRPRAEPHAAEGEQEGDRLAPAP
jgi:hypothetical protein